MRALTYAEYGDPSVLRLAEVPEPHAGPGQVRIRVRAASLNPYDAKLRSGAMRAMAPVTFPAIPGLDASGVVDEVGDGVTGVAPGDAVLGLGRATHAAYAVLDHWTPVPDGLSFTDAAALPTVGETAARCLDLLGLAAGDVVVLDGASGGVGTLAVQLAVQRGLIVVATASAANQTYLTDLGALATTYGAGLPERVRGLLVPYGSSVAGAVDLAGQGSVPDLIELTGDPARVVTIADFSAGELGAQVTGGSSAFYALAEVAALAAGGRLSLDVAIWPWEQAAEAAASTETGHARGKTVLSIS